MLRRLGLLLALIVGACTFGDGDDDPAVSTSTLPDVASTMRVAAGDWPQCFNPLTCDDDGVLGSLVLQHVLPKLHEVGPDGTYRPSPVLDGRPVVAVDPDTGRQTISYRLAEAATWHDGRPMTSSDVVGTWLAVMQTATADTTGYDRIVRIDDADPLVAVVTLASPWADWRELFGGRRGWLLQADAFGASPDLLGAFHDELPFGAGPYEVTTAADDLVVLSARAQHWVPERQAAMEHVRLERVESDGADPDALAGFHAVVGVDISRVGGLARRMTPTDEVVGVFFDRRSLPLQQAQVRQAIDVGLSRADLVGLMTAPGDEPLPVVECLGWLPTQDLCEPDLPPGPADTARAAELLTAAGWVRGPAGLEREGVPLDVPLTVDPTVPNASVLSVALRVRLRTLGFDVEVTGGDLLSWLRPGREAPTGVGVFRVPFGTVERLDDVLRCDGGLNALAWCPPELVEALAALDAAVTGDQLAAAAAGVSSLAAEARSWLPVVQVHEAWFVGPEVVVPADVSTGVGPLAELHRFDLDA